MAPAPTGHYGPAEALQPVPGGVSRPRYPDKTSPGV